MSSNDRRILARRRAWGRGPSILRFEPLEGRQLLSGNDPLAALASTLTTASAAETSTPAQTTSAVTTPDIKAATPTSTTIVATAPKSDTSVMVATAFNTDHNLDWGDTFHATGRVENQGTGPSVSSYHVEIYASSTPKLGSDGVLLGSVAIPSGIAAGSASNYDQVLTAPRAPFSKLGSAPSYYIIPKLVSDAPTTKPAVTTSALVSVNTPLLNSVVTITPKIPPKLVAAKITVSPGHVQWGDTITVAASVTNQSQGIAPPTNARVVLTPVGKTPGGSSDYQIGQVPIPPVGGYQTANATQTIILPQYVPTSLSGFTQYTVTLIPDADAVANTLVTGSVNATSSNTTSLVIGTPPVTTTPAVKPPAADLTVTKVLEPSPTMFRGATFPVGATVQNLGPGDAGAFKVRFLLVTDASSPALVLGDASISGLAAGTEQDVVQTVTLPYRTPDAFSADSSTAHIVAEVDPDRSIDQSNTGNDSLAAPTVGLKVLTADAQTTTVPVATTTTTTTITPVVTTPTTTTDTPTSTTAPTTTATPPTTTTAAPTPTPTPVTPVVSTPVTHTPTSSIPKSAIKHSVTVVKHQAAKPTTKKAIVHTQVIAPKPHVVARPKVTARAHPLKVYRPTSNLK